LAERIALLSFDLSMIDANRTHVKSEEPNDRMAVEKVSCANSLPNMSHATSVSEGLFSVRSSQTDAKSENEKAQIRVAKQYDRCPRRSLARRKSSNEIVGRRQRQILSLSFSQLFA
jgi:hypothetical protein